MPATTTELEATVKALAARLATLEQNMTSVAASTAAQADYNAASSEADIIIQATTVIFMQAGFTMLEAGTVSAKHVQSILLKNLMDGVVAAIFWWLCGYAFYSGESASSFIGGTSFAGGIDAQEYTPWLHSYAFLVTSCTIVSGAVASRMHHSTYIFYAFVHAGWVYPAIAHWTWSSSGWLSSRGFLDFAGSAVVHLSGAACAIVGAWMVGPRYGRFRRRLDKGAAGGGRECCCIDKKFSATTMKPHSILITTLGTMMLSYCWYQFNASSAGGTGPDQVKLASRAAINTCLASAAAALAVFIVGVTCHDHVDVGLALNGLLGGLVAITAPCAFCTPVAAVMIGALAGMVYLVSSKLVVRCRVDDPLDAFAVHGACGIFGTLAVGFVATPETVKLYAGDDSPYGIFHGGSAELLGIQLAAVLAITAWCMLHMALFILLVWATSIAVSRCRRGSSPTVADESASHAAHHDELGGKEGAFPGHWVRIAMDDQILGIDLKYHGKFSAKVGAMLESIGAGGGRRAPRALTFIYFLHCSPCACNCAYKLVVCAAPGGYAFPDFDAASVVEHNEVQAARGRAEMRAEAKKRRKDSLSDQATRSPTQSNRSTPSLSGSAQDGAA